MLQSFTRSFSTSSTLVFSLTLTLLTKQTILEVCAFGIGTNSNLVRPSSLLTKQQKGQQVRSDSNYDSNESSALSSVSSNLNDEDDDAILRGGGFVNEDGKSISNTSCASNHILVRLYKSYMRSIDKRPVITKSITAGIIGGAGDIISQVIEARVVNKIPFQLNLPRLVSFTVSGWIYVGPFVHYWYEVLWKIGAWQEAKFGSLKIWQTLTQVFVDQTIGVAIFFPIYFYAYEIVESFAHFRLPMMATATMKIQKEMLPVLLMQYKIWPLANYINFAYVPQSLRVLFSDIIAVFWNAYLCMKVA